MQFDDDTQPPQTPVDHRRWSSTKIGDLAADAGIGRIHVLAWRDLDDVEAGGLRVHPVVEFFLRQPATKGLARMFLLRRSLVNYADPAKEIWQAGKGVGDIAAVEPARAVVDRCAAALKHV